MLDSFEMIPRPLLEHLGDTYLKLNDSQNALKYYKKALTLKEKDTRELEEKIQRLIEDDFP